jgi:surface protein
MKKLLLLSVFFLVFHLSLPAQMILVYDTRLSGDNSISIPLYGKVDVIVDWGDGTIESYHSHGDHKHTYSTHGEYTVAISGSLERFGSGIYINYAYNLRKVISFGDLGLKSLSGAFNGAINLVEVPDNLPSSVTDLSYTFSGATSFNHPIGEWDVSNVTSMNSTFYNASSFNQDISKWDVGNVTTMQRMFFECTSFNQDIGKWNVRNVVNMSEMFSYAGSFNQYIGSWDVSKVQNMFSMFTAASSFNQDIGRWDVGSVTTMNSMFHSALSFNQDIGNWDVSNVECMGGMFGNAISFDQDIGGWDVSNVLYMRGMFWDAESFDQNIGAWNVSNVESVEKMFTNGKLSTANYNGLLIGWASRELKPNLHFDAGYSQFSPGEAYDAFMHILSAYRWQMQGGWISLLPAITTTAITEITPASAISGGKITADGGYDVTERGIVWHTAPNPTLELNSGFTTNGSGMGDFFSDLAGLEAGVTYYVRAYAVNNKGTGYGNSRKFTAAKELTLYGNYTIEEKVYDGTRSAIIETSNIFLEGIMDEYDDVSIADVIAGFADADAGEGKSVSLHRVTLKGNEKDKYYLSLADAPFATGKISPKKLTLGGSFTVEDKFYDGSTDAAIIQNNLTLLKPLTGDEVKITDVLAAFGDPSAGNDKTVYITSVTLEGSHKHNYLVLLDNSPLAAANIMSTLDVKDISESVLQVYPNPFSGFIKVESTQQISRIVLINITGQIVALTDMPDKILADNLKNGVYFLQVEFFNNPPQIVRLIKM